MAEFAKVGTGQIHLLILGTILMIVVPLVIAIIWTKKKMDIRKLSFILPLCSRNVIKNDFGNYKLLCKQSCNLWRGNRAEALSFPALYPNSISTFTAS